MSGSLDLSMSINGNLISCLKLTKGVSCILFFFNLLLKLLLGNSLMLSPIENVNYCYSKLSIIYEHQAINSDEHLV